MFRLPSIDQAGNRTTKNINFYKFALVTKVLIDSYMITIKITSQSPLAKKKSDKEDRRIDSVNLIFVNKPTTVCHFCVKFMS